MGFQGATMKKTLALLTALVSFSCASPPPPLAPALRTEEPFVLDRPRAELLKKLDEMVQWRFSQITPEDLRQRRFGMNRMPNYWIPDRPIAVHEKKPIDRLSGEGWAAAVYVVRERVDDSPGKVLGPVVAGDGSWSPLEDRRKIEELGHLAMSLKTAVSGSSHGIPLEARLVPASAPVCQKCHTKEIGEPVGAVVYAFHRERPPVATSGR
jgi:hypothetical protein